MTDMRVICRDHGVVANMFNVEKTEKTPPASFICPYCGKDVKEEYVDHIEIKSGGDGCCPLPHVVKAAKEKEIEYYRNKYWPELKEEKNGN